MAKAPLPKPARTVAASSLRGVLAYARATKVPTASALAAAGLDEAALAGTDTRVSEEATNALWARLAEASADPDFGLHFAERMTVDALDVVGHLLTRTPTLGEGLARVVAYSRILHDAGRVELEEKGDRVVVYPGCRGLAVAHPRHVAEMAAASVVVLARAVTGSDIRARAVRFRHARPASGTREHARIFGVTPTFDNAETEVEIDRSVLDLRVLDPQPGVLDYLDAYARDVIAKLPEDDDLVSRVEREVASSLSRGVPDIDTIAARLATSTRTLQRRLADAETSFQAVVDGVRREFAERYLTDARLAVTEIAFLVGFSEPSNFHRAFRRWTGETPARYRERALAERKA